MMGAGHTDCIVFTQVEEGRREGEREERRKGGEKKGLTWSSFGQGLMDLQDEPDEYTHTHVIHPHTHNTLTHYTHACTQTDISS